MLNVQSYLKSASLLDLKEKYGIDYRIKDHKVSLNYNQIEAKSGCKIVEECRGLIIRKADKSPILHPDEIFGESHILNMAFRRFYNHTDGYAAKIDWDSATIQEKLDGTSVMLYFDDVSNEWHTATRKVCEADLNVSDGDFTFRQLFENALHDSMGLTFDVLTDELVPGETYIFELCTPYNKIVVNYDDNLLYYLGGRNLSSLEEFSHPIIFDFPRPKTYSLSSVDDIIKFVNDQDPTKQEGVVVVDKFFNRIKIKSISYCTYNRLHDTLNNSKKNCLIMVLEEKVDDILPFMPNPIQRNLIAIQKGIGQYINHLESKIAEGKQFVGEGNARAFADWLHCQCAEDESLWTGPMFAIYRGQASNLVDWLEKNKHNGEYNKNHLDHLLNKMGL